MLAVDLVTEVGFVVRSGPGSTWVFVYPVNGQSKISYLDVRTQGPPCRLTLAVARAISAIASTIFRDAGRKVFAVNDQHASNLLDPSVSADI